MELISIDFESEAIEDRPKYPPTPVGVAICSEGGVPAYHSWGHPTENNCTLEYATRKLKRLLEDPNNEFVFHNTPFDCSILEEKLGLVVPWTRVHDTMVLAFLDDPFGELSLKPLAEQHLGLPPNERDAVKEWLISNGVCRDTKG